MYKTKKLKNLFEDWERELLDFESQLLDAYSYEDDELEHQYLRLPRKWHLRLFPTLSKPDRYREFWALDHHIPVYLYEDGDGRAWVALRNNTYER